MKKPLPVLIVEDSAEDALLVIRELERGGYDTTFERVETAEAMTAALEKQAWDVIIADYNLPHFTAPAALDLFKETGLDLPFIVVSGTVGEDTAVETMKAGAHDYLMKGNLTRLVPAIERELHEAEVRKERKRAEEALQESEERYRNLIENTLDMIQSVAPDGHFVFVNRAWLEALGYPEAELPDLNLFNIIHPESLAHCQELFAKVMRGESVQNVQVTFIAKDGREILVEGNATPRYVGSNIIATQGIFRDITERKKMEEQLIVTDRLASIGELAAGIAHELNNPLTSVIGFTQLLLDKDISDDVKDDIKIIYSEAQRTAEVVKHLLTFARKHAPVKQLVNINSIIKKVWKLRAYEQRVSNIQVNTKLAPDLPEITADYFQLQQVFLNIVINAEHFMIEAHRRGTLTITTERVGDVIRASFADDGPGISKENLRHLFDPFFTTKEVGKGTGLGLSICHGIITEHDGQIYAESELGKGATFVVELPVKIAD